MTEAVDKILSYCSDIRSEAELVASSKTFDACLRNLQVLGESSSKIPVEIQAENPGIPWREIKGMRNILVHEYFGVSPSIVWTTVSKNIPMLKEALERIRVRYETTSHSWRICPPGEIYVRQANVNEHLREGAPVREHLRRDHCREIESSGKDTLTYQEVQDISKMCFEDLQNKPNPHPLGFGKAGIEFDSLIAGWTQYWNEVLRPEPTLNPNIVKALIASESSFDSNSGRKKRNGAKGLMQLMPATIKYLNGERKELKDHIFSFQGSEVYDPSLNIAAGIRWLFRKRETASARLRRKATWEEAVEEYKDYLHRRLKNPKAKQKGMEVFRQQFSRLSAEGRE